MTVLEVVVNPQNTRIHALAVCLHRLQQRTWWRYLCQILAGLERVCSKFCRFLQFSSVLVDANLLAGDTFDDLMYCVKLRSALSSAVSDGGSDARRRHSF